MEELVGTAEKAPLGKGTATGPDCILAGAEVLATQAKSHLTRSLKPSPGVTGVPQRACSRINIMEHFLQRSTGLEVDRGGNMEYSNAAGVLMGAADPPQLAYRVKESLERIARCMKYRDSEIAPDKTEVIIFDDHRRKVEILFSLIGIELIQKKTIKYLGIVLGTKLVFGLHVKQVIRKAENSLSALIRIMPSIGGPRGAKGGVLYGMVHRTIGRTELGDQDIQNQAGRIAVHSEDSNSRNAAKVSLLILLFSTHTSDIPTTVHVNLAMHTDDVCIFTRSLNARIVDRRLQTALDTLQGRIAAHPEKRKARPSIAPKAVAKEGNTATQPNSPSKEAPSPSDHKSNTWASYWTPG
ncbi:hypothetical protein Trydic_g7210 [Trypoxylus dichotomus]